MRAERDVVIDRLDAERILQKRARSVIEILHAHAAREDQAAAAPDVVDQLALSLGVALPTAHGPQHRDSRDVEVAAFELDRRIRTVRQRQPAGEQVEEHGVAFVCQQGRGDLRGRVVDLGHVVVELEPNVGRDLWRRRHKVGAIGAERIRQAAVTGEMAAGGAVFAHRVAPGVAARATEDRVVLAVEEQVVVDRAHAARHAQPAMEIIERRLPAREVEVAARLKFDREERLLWVLQRLGHLVDEDHVVEVAFVDEHGIDVGGADHAVHLHDLHELRQADRERLAAVAKAVDVDDGRHLKPIGAGVVKQERHVVANVRAIEAPVVFDRLPRVRGRGVDQALAQQIHRDGRAIALHQSRSMGRVQIGRETLERVGVRVEMVGDPLQHPHLVVELDHDDVAAARHLARRQHLEHALIPARDAGAKIRVHVAGEAPDRVVRRDEQAVRMIVEHPIRDSLVRGLGHDVGPRAGDDPEPHLGREIEEAGQVAHRMGRAGDIDGAFGHLVPEPRDVSGQRVEAGFTQTFEPGAPLISRSAEVMKLARLQHHGLIIDQELTIGHFECRHERVLRAALSRRAVARAHLL